HAEPLRGRDRHVRSARSERRDAGGRGRGATHAARPLPGLPREGAVGHRAVCPGGRGDGPARPRPPPPRRGPPPPPTASASLPRRHHALSREQASQAGGTLLLHPLRHERPAELAPAAPPCPAGGRSLRGG